MNWRKMKYLLSKLFTECLLCAMAYIDKITNEIDIQLLRNRGKRIYKG
jgi:hypothetical protein